MLQEYHDSGPVAQTRSYWRQDVGDRRYWRAVDEASEEADRKLDEAMERERLLRDETHSGGAEEPRRYHE